MRYASLVQGLSMVLYASARIRAQRCGSEILPQQVLAAEKDFALKSTIEALQANLSDIATMTVQVHFHVIAAESSVLGGWIRDHQVQSQILTLNRDFEYSGTGLRFELVNTTRTINPDWFHNVRSGNSFQRAMKTALRSGGARDLNIYSVGFTNASLLGYATFPLMYQFDPLDDGIVIHHATVPPGSKIPYNRGRTAVHEVGHWVGLYHTFQDGCSHVGDEVVDTPPEAGPAYGCQVGRDSCPEHTGLDAVHNFMNYSDDACMKEFTPGQVVRMRALLSIFRGIPM
ncbi:metalloprotease [Coprinopsis marcescibilis]|uniref:Metalloprotease n=1 Tax=Coprinopsis marcescibilis TaxID=230819 RepID=A0A5C3KAU7_COPMA|nr:metalloprotease [Coprinopsis marcescibilis]